MYIVYFRALARISMILTEKVSTRSMTRVQIALN